MSDTEQITSIRLRVSGELGIISSYDVVHVKFTDKAKAAIAYMRAVGIVGDYIAENPKAIVERSEDDDDTPSISLTVENIGHFLSRYSTNEYLDINLATDIDVAILFSKLAQTLIESATEAPIGGITVSSKE